jgi:Rad3-related DNA helicase
MSATISRKDLEMMGLDRRRIGIVRGESPIPVERRPIHLQYTGNYSYSTQDRDLPALVEFIRQKLAENRTAGMIHAPYSMAQKLAAHFQQEPRILSFNQDTKQQVYERFRKEGPEKGLVLIASGLYEGVSLDEDAGRWQVVCKVPYPSLGEPGYKWMSEKDPESYAWLAIRLIVQASGRISRSATDFGKTYIVDRSFERLLEKHEELFPAYFLSAIQEEVP